MLDAFTWYKQSSLLWNGGELVVHIDPWDVPDGEPQADLILITHAHFDHFSEPDIAKVSKEGTIVVAPHDVAGQLSSGDVRAVKPGERIEAAGLGLDVVPAYNVKPERQEFHPRDNDWVGYLVTLGGTRYYISGDTDHIPEMSDVQAEVAFVPIGGTYTMDVQEAAGAIREIAPRLAVPTHFGFVVGKRHDGDAFVEAIKPVEGRVLTPRHAFEQE